MKCAASILLLSDYDQDKTCWYQLYLENKPSRERKEKKEEINPAYTPGDEIIPTAQRLAHHFRLQCCHSSDGDSLTVKMMDLTHTTASKVNARD